MKLLVIVTVVMQLAVACTGRGWTANEYPNPQTDAISCNRKNKSSVCDPEVLLSTVDANQLDSVIAGVEANVKDSCVTSRAFRIRVALVEKLKDTSSKSMTGTPDELAARKMKRALDLMKMFASKTHERWNSNEHCKVDVIIAYSRQDGVIYTFASEDVEQDFTPFIINDITSQANINSKHLADGLEKMIRNYGEVFNDTYKPRFVPKYQPVRSALMTGCGGCLHSHLAVVLTALFIFFFLSRAFS